MKIIMNKVLRKYANQFMGANNAGKQNLLLGNSENSSRARAPETLPAGCDIDFVKRTVMRLSHQELESQKNLEDIIGEADKELDEMPADEGGMEMDEGWFNRFSNFAMCINDKDMKRVWAKILAGEIRRPDTYSIRTLNLVSMLSKKEVEIISNMTQFVLYDYSGNHNGYILNSKTVKDVKFSDVMLLMELGLVDNTSTLAITLDKNGEESVNLLLVKKDQGLCISSTQEHMYVHIYKLTSLGKEIMQLIDEADLNINYVKEYCENLIKSDKTMSVTCAKILKIEGNDVDLDEEHAYFKIGAKFEQKEGE